MTRIPTSQASNGEVQKREHVSTWSTMSLTMASNCCAASCVVGISCRGIGGLGIVDASNISESGVFCDGAGPLTTGPEIGPADTSGDTGPERCASKDDGLDSKLPF